MKIKSDGYVFKKCRRCCCVRVKGYGCVNVDCFEFSQDALSIAMMVTRKRELMKEVLHVI